VTVCEKVVPQLNKHDDVMNKISRKLPPPKWRAGCAPDVASWPEPLNHDTKWLGREGVL